MTIIFALAVFITFFLGLIAFIKFCDWILSRREITS
jgi:hypothetical protein